LNQWVTSESRMDIDDIAHELRLSEYDSVDLFELYLTALMIISSDPMIDVIDAHNVVLTTREEIDDEFINLRPHGGIH